MSDKHHRYYKHTKFRQNPRGDPKFLVDLTWNDPIARRVCEFLILCLILQASGVRFSFSQLMKLMTC